MESKKKKKKGKTRRQSRFLNCIQLNWMELICIFYSPIFHFSFGLIIKCIVSAGMHFSSLFSGFSALIKRNRVQRKSATVNGTKNHSRLTMNRRERKKITSTVADSVRIFIKSKLCAHENSTKPATVDHDTLHSNSSVDHDGMHFVDFDSNTV